MARAGIVPQLPAQRLPLQAQPPPQQQQQQQQQLQSPPYAFLDIASLIRQAVKVQTPMSCLRNHKSPAFESLRVATIVLSPRERWLFAIRTVVKLLHNLKHTVHTGGRKIDNAPGVNERSLTYALKEFQYQADLILSTKIQQYLDKKLPKTEDEIAMLNRLLMTRMTSFAKYNYDQRIRFCNAMSYEAHRKGSVIIRQGHLPYYFYFILSGQVEVLKDRSDGFTGQLRLTLLNQGDCFGEVALDGSYQERRTTTVICTAPCEFLRIDKDDYRNIIIGEDSVSDVMTRIRLLRNVPVFALADDQILEQAVLKTQVRHYERNSVILKENDSNKRLFFIVSGKCRIEKSIQLFRKYAVGNGDYRLRPDRKSTQPIRKGEERIQETVSLAEIHEGASFPEPLPAGVVASTTADRLDLISKINDHDALSLNRSYVSVIAVNPVVCITMERIDFARIMSWGMLKNLLDSSILFSIPVEAMQDQFVIQKGWDAYKRKIVEEMMLRRTGEKWVKRNGWQQWQNQAMCRL
ncbi:hypothetical protein BC831DRAFT_407873 [Entophlyctis helioformis]|nr:hypothetical protein BC831DRAFT_407873 [Entophlyctis helioformis]